MGDVECEDINECKNNPCKNGNCTNLEGSYECVCQNGFQIKLDKNFCEDVNECLYDNGGCDHLCSNIEGSRICSCRNGYQVSSKNLDKCEDVDECQNDNGGCPQVWYSTHHLSFYYPHLNT